MNLKECSIIGLKDMRAVRDYKEFRTIGFDPDELLQLKEMNTKELIGLMVYCGIHVFNGVPLLVMTNNEMRTAYLGWRAIQIEEKKSSIRPRIRRLFRWMNKFYQVIED